MSAAKFSNSKPISQVVGDEFGDEIRQGSMVSHEHIVSELLNIIKPRVLLEIGTLKGLSSAMFARYCPKVITVDIEPDDMRLKMWKSFGVEEKIIPVLINSNRQKAQILKKTEFDMAFLDGDHSYGGVRSDFKITKCCGCVLFHDYKPDQKKFKGLVKFVDRLKPVTHFFGMPHSRFAIWIAKDHPLRANSELQEWLAINRC